MKFVTLAALAALSAAAPALADDLATEQARADYHQARADAARAQVQKEDAQTQADAATVEREEALARAHAAREDIEDSKFPQ
jgi:hypothetical protein